MPSNTQMMDFGDVGRRMGKSLGEAFTGDSYQKGYLEAAPKYAQMALHNAQAKHYDLQTEELRQQMEARKPENMSRMAAGLLGLPDPQREEAKTYLATGGWGMNPAYEDDAKQMTMAPTPKTAPGWATPEKLERMAQLRSALETQLALTGKTDFSNLMGGMKQLWERQMEDRARSGQMTPQEAHGLNVLESARKGELISFNEYGVGDKSTGTLTFNQPYLDKNASVIRQNNAQAANASANAALHRAQIPKVQAETMEVIRKANEGRPLPNIAIKELNEKGGTAADFRRLYSSFKDAYGGYGAETVGDLVNLYQRNVGGDTDGQAQWWQDYQNQKNSVRHQLFGSALTATERAEFDKAQINPGMTPDQITKNLERQKVAAEGAARKLAFAYAKGGYSKDQIEAALGMPLDGLQQPVRQPQNPPALPATSAPKIQRGQIVDGYRFKGVDPANPANWEKVK